MEEQLITVWWSSATVIWIEISLGGGLNPLIKGLLYIIPYLYLRIHLSSIIYRRGAHLAFFRISGRSMMDGSPPVFEQIFRNARFAQGGNAFFEGKVSGNPQPELSWTREGQPLSGKHFAEELNNSWFD